MKPYTSRSPDHVSASTSHHPPPTHWHDRPREKLIQRGPNLLSPVELLAVILNTGSGQNSDVMTLAHDLLQQIGGLGRLCTATVEELLQIKGIGPAKAARLVAAFEMARRGAIRHEISDLEQAKYTIDHELIQRAQSYMHNTKQFSSVTLIAYPTESRLNDPNTFITLSVESSISILKSQTEMDRLSPQWLRRLLSQHTMSWGFIAFYHQDSKYLEPSLKSEQEALEHFIARAELLGLSIDHYLIIQDERYAWLKPNTQGRFSQLHQDRGE